MAVPEFLTDPAEIALILAVRALPPGARVEFKQLLQAMADKEPAHVQRASMLRLMRTLGWTEAAAIRVVNAALRPRAYRS